MANNHLQVILGLSVGLFSVIQAQESANYFGKKIGDFTNLGHGVAGSVYAIDSTTLWIRGFSYDGAAPDAFFWAGTTDTNPTASGEIIPDENGSLNKLNGYTDADIILNLPTGRVITDYKWISVWCRQHTANFGDVLIASDFVAPSSLSLGVLGLNPLVHNVRADDVIILDSQTVKFVNIDYDGGGPAAYFWVGTGSAPSTSGYRVPDENGSKNTILRAFDGEDITIKFDGDLTVFAIDYIGLWCETATQSFGHVLVPDMPSVPPSYQQMEPPPPTPPSLENCEPLSDTFQVLWQIRDQSINIELRGLVATDNYMAFGLSGSEERTSMQGSDVTVAWFDGTEGQAVDYHLNSYSQCSGGFGACPDTLSSTVGTNSVTNVEGSDKDGITSIAYTRQLDTGDALDTVIPTDREVYISWAIGLINADGLAVKHDTRTPTSSGNGKTINFGRTASNLCESLEPGVTPPTLEPWEPSKISPTTTEFEVKIGQSGGERGYTGITGKPGWGIAWYVNGLLIPELKVQRGNNYTFRVFGGSDSSQAANYHPFYITNDDAGGLASLSTEEIMMMEDYLEIYAGPFNGSLCKYVNTGEDQAATSDTFSDYFQTLTEECVSPSEPAEFVWTPDENTPDLVYYQCYTHRYLGWKIQVVDLVLPTGSASTNPDTNPTTGSQKRTTVDPTEVTDSVDCRPDTDKNSNKCNDMSSNGSLRIHICVSNLLASFLLACFQLI